jgi:hypothetical protein
MSGPGYRLAADGALAWSVWVPSGDGEEFAGRVRRVGPRNWAGVRPDYARSPGFDTRREAVAWLLADR